VTCTQVGALLHEVVWLVSQVVICHIKMVQSNLGKLMRFLCKHNFLWLQSPSGSRPSLC
jgi:hypothetical protein